MKHDLAEDKASSLLYKAHLLTTEDSDWRSLGDIYEGVPIVSWRELQRELPARKLANN